MKIKIPRLKAGDLITEGYLNKLIDAANACNITVGDGGSLNISDTPDGYTLDAVFEEKIVIKTTAGISSGTYAFTEQLPDASGAWVDGTFTDVAYEGSGKTDVSVGTIADAWRTSEGDWRFLAGECG